jgi:hypothetical protein
MQKAMAGSGGGGEGMSGVRRESERRHFCRLPYPGICQAQHWSFRFCHGVIVFFVSTQD